MEKQKGNIYETTLELAFSFENKLNIKIKSLFFHFNRNVISNLLVRPYAIVFNDVNGNKYKYTMEKQGTTNYKFIAYDNDKILNNYNLYTSNQTSLVQKWQIHKDGDYLLVSKSKYVKNGTYYIAYEDDLNTKYAITIK